MEITYTTTDCRLGRLLLAASAKGLCAVSIGKNDAELERKLHDQFPNESTARDDRSMKSLAADVKGRIEGKGLDRKIPLDLRGTPFQIDVWKEMLLDKEQKIARPRQIYIGPAERPYTPSIEHRHAVTATKGKKDALRS